MRHILTILAVLFVCSAPAQAQTMKALMYNTTNGQVAYSGTNGLRFVESVAFSSDVFGFSFEAGSGSNYTQVTPDGVDFSGEAQRTTTRANLGFSTNLNTLWTATNASTAFNALNLGLYPDEGGSLLGAANALWDQIEQAPGLYISDGGPIFGGQGAGGWRTNLALGATNIVTFAGLTIANTTATNGILFIRRTNNEAFLGLANLIASNNTTVSNETLFRVGVSEATNKAAQFGFRATNTNGNGVAVFSVFGFNALMMVGADASTNAVIYSGGGTNNEVMTLIRDGATEFARPLRFSTNASTRPATNAPANTTNVAAWVEMRIGTNSYRVPLYQ